MNTLVRYGLSIGAAVLIAGCGNSQPPVGAPGAMVRTSTSYSYKVLLKFGSAPRRRSRGRRPGGLLNMGETFYGVTTGGGGHNDGTVF